MRHFVRAALRLLAAFALGFAGSAQAGETEPLSESEFLKEMPVVLSASRLSQPLSESPAAITVIDRGMIAASGFRQIADLFRLVPGFYVTYSNGYKPIVTYHGLADEYARRMQVLIDGRSVYMPPYGGVEWSDLPLAIEDIERIEVIRGPSAASHGANSFLGVINIATRHASQDRGAYLSVIQGGYGVGDGLLRYGGNEGNLDYRLTMGYRSDYGMSDDYQGIQHMHDPQRVKMFTLRADYRMGNRDTLQFQAGYNGGQRGLGSKAPQFVYSFRDAAIDSNFEQLRWQRNFGADEEISVQFFHNYRRVGDVVLNTLLPPIVTGRYPVDLGDASQRYDLEVQHTLSPAKNWRVVWGGSARLDQSAAPLFFRNGAQLHQRRLFSHGEWRLNEKTVLNVGAMAENNDLTGTDVSPRISVNYHLSSRHTLRAGISRAYRTPVLVEAMGNKQFSMPTMWGMPVDTMIPPSYLRPEKMLSREIGYVGEIPEAGLLLDFKLFHDQISDLIDQQPATPAAPYFCPLGCTTFGNLDSAVETGLDGQIKYQPSKNTQIVANYARTLISATNVADTLAGKPNDFRLSRSAPVNSVSVLATHRYAGGFSGSVAYYQQGEVRALGSGERTDLFRRIDLRLAQRFTSGKSKGEVALVLQNLFRENYSELRQEFRFPPLNYLTLSLQF